MRDGCVGVFARTPVRFDLFERGGPRGHGREEADERVGSGEKLGGRRRVARPRRRSLRVNLRAAPGGSVSQAPVDLGEGAESRAFARKLCSNPPRSRCQRPPLPPPPAGVTQGSRAGPRQADAATCFGSALMRTALGVSHRRDRQKRSFELIASARRVQQIRGDSGP